MGPDPNRGVLMGASLIPLIYVGIGGMLGAVARYLATLATAGISLTLPYGTLISNLAGCFLIGIVAALAAEGDLLSPEARLFLATGFCGGFTTMSSFVYELAQLLRSGELYFAAAYFGLTLVGAMVLFYLGSVTVVLLRS
jgi:CrcB protein